MGHALPCRCMPTGSRGLMRRVIIKTPFRAHGGERRAIIQSLPRLSCNGLVNGPLCGRSYYTYCIVRWTNTEKKIWRWARRSNGVAAEGRFRGRPRPLERPGDLPFFLDTRNHRLSVESALDLPSVSCARSEMTFLFKKLAIICMCVYIPVILIMTSRRDSS